ncbi:MAG: TonB-dependent receptor [bacterium]
MKISFKHILLLALLILAISATEIFTQQTGTIRGLVTDSTNGEVLAFANIFIKEAKTGAITNNRGYFIITSLPRRKNYSVRVSYIGYETKTVTVKILDEQVVDVNIKLTPTSIELQTIEKVGYRIDESNATDIGMHRITIQDLEKIPKGVETDLMRALQYLPGVQSVGDVSSRYYVRGGTSNQNLVLLDGVTLYNPFHAFGLFSVIDPEMINNVEFYKAGFPSEHGGRISSILKITTREGNKNNFGGSASLSLLTFKGSVEGPFPHGSFILTGRKSYSSDILKKFLNNEDIPFNFWDLSFRVNYHNNNRKFFDNSKFTIHGFFSGDRLESDDPAKEEFSWTNSMIGFKRFQVYDAPLYSELSVSASKFNAELNPKLSKTRAMKNTVEDFSLRMDFTYIYDSRDELSVGMMITGIRTSLYLQNRNGVFTDISDFGANINIYGKYKFLRFDNFGVDAGLRINLESYHEGGNFFFEPRVNLNYRFFPGFAVVGSWGVYQQGITTITNENDVVPLFEPYFITPGYLVPARATHYNLGFDIKLMENVTTNIEGYFKDMKHIPVINLEKKSFQDPDLVEASGNSYGMEFMARYEKDPVSFGTSYTLSWVKEKIGDEEFYPRYDSRHSIKTLFELNIGAGWLSSVTWTFNTGYPFTPTAGYYDKFHSSDFSMWDIYESYEPFIILGERNSQRLPAYHRLDFSISKKFAIDFVKMTFDLSVLNVYDRHNLFYFKRDTGERVNMLPFLITATMRAEI